MTVFEAIVNENPVDVYDLVLKIIIRTAFHDYELEPADVDVIKIREIRQTADSPSSGDAGPDNKEPPPTGVDQHKCLGGGVVSENAGAASIQRVDA